jgi:hypothetical protein
VLCCSKLIKLKLSYRNPLSSLSENAVFESVAKTLARFVDG